MYKEYLNAQQYQRDLEHQAVNERLNNEIRREQRRTEFAKLGQTLITVGKQLEARAEKTELKRAYR